MTLDIDIANTCRHSVSHY